MNYCLTAHIVHKKINNESKRGPKIRFVYRIGSHDVSEMHQCFYPMSFSGLSIFSAPCRVVNPESITGRYHECIFELFIKYFSRAPFGKVKCVAYDVLFLKNHYLFVFFNAEKNIVYTFTNSNSQQDLADELQVTVCEIEVSFDSNGLVERIFEGNTFHPSKENTNMSDQNLSDYGPQAGEYFVSQALDLTFKSGAITRRFVVGDVTLCLLLSSLYYLYKLVHRNKYAPQSGEYTLTIPYPSIEDVKEYFPLVLTLLFVPLFYMFVPLLDCDSDAKAKFVQDCSFRILSVLRRVARQQNEQEELLNRVLKLLQQLPQSLNKAYLDNDLLCDNSETCNDECFLSVSECDADLLSKSFSKVPFFIQSSLLPNFDTSPEFQSQLEALYLLRDFDFEVVAHEATIAGGDYKPDIVLRKDGLYFIMECKQSKPKMTSKQCVNACEEFHKLTGLPVVGLMYTSTLQTVNVLFSGTGSWKRKIPFHKWYNMCFAHYKSINQKHFTVQAGEYSCDYETRNESVGSGKRTVVAGVALATSLISYMLTKFSVDDIKSLYSHEVVSTARADSVIDSDYSIDYNTKNGSVSVHNNKISGDDDFIEITSTKSSGHSTPIVPRSKSHLIEVDINGDVADVHLEHMTQDMFRRIQKFFQPAVKLAKEELDVTLACPTRYEDFLLLPHHDQNYLVQSVYIYATTRDSLICYRNLMWLMTGVRLDSHDYTAFQDAAQADILDDMVRPMQLDRYRKTHKSDEYYRKHKKH